MGGSAFLGQFEQMVMLTILQLGDEAHAINIRVYLEEQASHRVTRGALYRTLDRLEAKGHVEWESVDPTPERGGIPKRLFSLTEKGLAVLRASHGAIHALSQGLEVELRGP